MPKCVIIVIELGKNADGGTHLYTISRDYRNEIVIEKSRFICTLKKVASEAEAQEFIKDASNGLIPHIILFKGKR